MGRAIHDDLDAALAQSMFEADQRKQRELEEDLALVAQAQQREEMEERDSAIREVDEMLEADRQLELDTKLAQCNIQGKY